MAYASGSESGTIEMAALGRPLKLGMLYDCRTDTMGSSLWDNITIANNLGFEEYESDQEFTFHPSDTIADKANALCLSSGMKLSLLSGLIEVDGSAKFFTDRARSVHTRRATLSCRRINKSENLNLEDLNIAPDDFGNFTHVVTKIWYGEQAFFLFENDISKHRQVDDTWQKLIEGIPSIDIDNAGLVQLTEEQKAQVRNVCVEYYGDFPLSQNPTTFEEVVHIFKTLSQLSNKGSELPLTVLLYPLRNFSEKANMFIDNISGNIFNLVEQLEEDFCQYDIRCNDIRNSTAANNMPELEKQVSNFKYMLSLYRQNIRNELATVIPKVRNGDLAETAVVSIVEKKEKSPFSSYPVSSWLKNKETEINIVQQFVNILPGVRFLSGSAEINSLMTSSNVKVVSFRVQRKRNNSLLTSMEKHLKEGVLQLQNVETLEPVDEQFQNMLIQNSTVFMRNHESGNSDVQFVILEEIIDYGEPQVFVCQYQDGNETVLDVRGEEHCILGQGLRKQQSKEMLISAEQQTPNSVQAKKLATLSHGEIYGGLQPCTWTEGEKLQDQTSINTHPRTLNSFHHDPKLPPVNSENPRHPAPLGFVSYNQVPQPVCMKSNTTDTQVERLDAVQQHIYDAAQQPPMGEAGTRQWPDVVFNNNQTHLHSLSGPQHMSLPAPGCTTLQIPRQNSSNLNSINSSQPGTCSGTQYIATSRYEGSQILAQSTGCNNISVTPDPFGMTKHVQFASARNTNQSQPDYFVSAQEAQLATGGSQNFTHSIGHNNTNQAHQDPSRAIQQSHFVQPQGFETAQMVQRPIDPTNTIQTHLDTFGVTQQAHFASSGLGASQHLAKSLGQMNISQPPQGTINASWPIPVSENNPPKPYHFMTSHGNQVPQQFQIPGTHQSQNMFAPYGHPLHHQSLPYEFLTQQQILQNNLSLIQALQQSQFPAYNLGSFHMPHASYEQQSPFWFPHGTLPQTWNQEQRGFGSHLDLSMCPPQGHGIPSQPNALSVVRKEHDSIMLKWEEAASEESISEYHIFCEEIGGRKRVIITSDECDEYYVDELKSGFEYQFKIMAISLTGKRSTYSKPTDVTATLPTSPPGKPEHKIVSYHKAEIKWDKPAVIGKMVDTKCCKYVVEVWSDKTNEWHKYDEVPAALMKIDYPIKPNFAYKFRVYMECGKDFGQSKTSPESDELNNAVSGLALVKATTNAEAQLLQNGKPSIYEITATNTHSNEEKKIHKFELGTENKITPKPEKVILIVGATGSGKTTLINGMVNYIFGINWEDDCRVKLIVESKDGKPANQAVSQTVGISSYTIHHRENLKIQFTLTIIDTPGFGDTSGIVKDKMITEQIKEFFTHPEKGGIDHIDAVGFVAQAALPRLTPTQKYIFDSILSLFGKDIEGNIFMLLTFADGQKPPVLDGLKEANLPYQKYFKFNNSALYADVTSSCSNKNIELKDSTSDEDDYEDDRDDFDEMFWKMGAKSFKLFLDSLIKVETKTLTLTRDVLDERSSLEVSILGIRNDIQSGLNTLEQLQHEMQVLRDHQADIDKNKEFTYTVYEETVELADIEPGKYTTNCLTCKRTCHYPCSRKDDKDKARCAAMCRTTGKCTVCPAQCYWNIHKNLPHKYIINRVEVTKTAADLKARYEVAMGKKLNAQQLLENVLDDFEEKQTKVVILMETVRLSLKRLNEIALKPNPLSTTEYIDLLIESERAEASPGWKERVNQLQEVRKEAEYMKKLADQGYDPFAQYKDKIKEAKKQRKGFVATGLEKLERFKPSNWFKK